MNRDQIVSVLQYKFKNGVPVHCRISVMRAIDNLDRYELEEIIGTPVTPELIKKAKQTAERDFEQRLGEFTAWD